MLQYSDLFKLHSGNASANLFPSRSRSSPAGSGTTSGAVSHQSTMKLGAQMEAAISRMNSAMTPQAGETANIQLTRLAGSMARLMTASQQGALTLQKLKSGGRQIVTVQHVTVESGGQAVVAGQVKAGGRGRKPGGSVENGV